MMNISCRTCKHWMGNKYSTWADCYWIIGAVNPELRQACLYDKENPTQKIWWKPPFDPHDIKYWVYSRIFVAEYNFALKTLDKLECRIQKEKKEDIKFDIFGGEHLGILTLDFIQTRKDYKCKYYIPLIWR